MMVEISSDYADPVRVGKSNSSSEWAAGTHVGWCERLYALPGYCGKGRRAATRVNPRVDEGRHTHHRSDGDWTELGSPSSYFAVLRKCICGCVYTPTCTPFNFCFLRVRNKSGNLVTCITRVRGLEYISTLVERYLGGSGTLHQYD